MNLSSMTILSYCSLLVLLLMMPITVVDSTPTLNFFTIATGYQEGHTGVATSTTASLVTQFAPGFAYAEYTLNVFNGVKVTQSHLHCAPAGVEGPVVAFLFGPNTKGVDIRKGKLASGRLQNANILNNTCSGVTINNIVSLYSAMKQGLIYVNVHTIAHPSGEVRGQVFE